MNSELKKLVSQTQKKPEILEMAIQQAYDLGRQDEKETKRTTQQNKGLHKDCEIIAEKLNDAGYDMRKIVKKELSIPWTTASVKEFIWKPIQKKMFLKESTTELDKHTEITKIHEVIMRELGEKFGIEWHEFPHDPKKQKEYEQAQTGRTDLNYPENTLGDPKF